MARRRTRRQRTTPAAETGHAPTPQPGKIARRAFGGVDVPASLAGTLVAVGMLVLLAALIAALGVMIAFQADAGVERPEVAMGGLIVGLLTVFVAFLTGGWAAGRMARYDGPVNGLMTGIWALLFMALSVMVGAWAATEYDLFLVIDVPNWIAVWTAQDPTGLAVASAVSGIAVMLLGGFLGGLLGTRYHRAADETIVVATEELHSIDRLPAGREPAEQASGAPRPLAGRSDEELLEERRSLLPPEGEADRRQRLAEIDEELRIRGYEPDRWESSRV